MKGTVETLLAAEDLARKGRFADAVKVYDLILGISPGADEAARLLALKAALKSTESWTDQLSADLLANAVTETVDGQLQTRYSFTPKRVRLSKGLVGVSKLLQSRMLCLIVSGQ